MLIIFQLQTKLSSLSRSFAWLKEKQVFIHSYRQKKLIAEVPYFNFSSTDKHSNKVYQDYK